MGKRVTVNIIDFDKNEETVVTDWIQSGYHLKTVNHCDDHLKPTDNHIKIIDKNGETIWECHIDLEDFDAYVKSVQELVELTTKFDEEEKKL